VTPLTETSWEKPQALKQMETPNEERTVKKHMKQKSTAPLKSKALEKPSTPSQPVSKSHSQPYGSWVTVEVPET